MAKYLDETGLAHFWGNTKDYIDKLPKKATILSPVLQGSMVYVSDGSNSIVFDCGDSTDTTRLETFFTENDAEIDCLIISHFDSDHFSGLSEVAKYLSADTDIFIQMEPTNDNGSYATYTSAMSTLSGIVSTYDLKTPVVPTEGLTKTYGDITLELHNTTAANAATYDATNGDSSNLANPSSNLNNYSLISIVNVGGIVVTYSGDIEAVSQRLNAQYMPKADIAFMPHHLSNKWGNLEWHTNQDPRVWVATTAASTFEGNIWYLWRYFYTLYLNGFVDNVTYSHSSALEVEFIDGCLSKLEGNTFKAALENDNPSHELSLYNILSPYYESDNPHCLYDMDLTTFMTAIVDAKNGAYFKSGTSANQSNFTWWKEILTVFASQSTKYDTLNAEVTVDGGVARVLFNSGSVYYDEILLYGTVDIANKSGYRIMSSGCGMKHVYQNAITANDYDLTADFDIVHWMCRADVIVVRTSGGLSVPCFRTTTSSDYLNVVAIAYTGYALNTAMTTMYRVNITSAGKITGTSRTLDDPTLSYISIDSIQAM